MDFENVFQYLSPLVSAFLASYLTQRLTERGKKKEALFQERLAAFKTLHRRLVAVTRYIDARLADTVGNEFAPGVSGLPADAPASALACTEALRGARDECSVYLTSRSRPSLDDLLSHLSLARSFELNSPGQADLEAAGPALYASLAAHVDLCIEAVFSELEFPVRK